MLGGDTPEEPRVAQEWDEGGGGGWEWGGGGPGRGALCASPSLRHREKGPRLLWLVLCREMRSTAGAGRAGGLPRKG